MILQLKFAMQLGISCPTALPSNVNELKTVAYIGFKKKKKKRVRVCGMVCINDLLLLIKNK